MDVKDKLTKLNQELETNILLTDDQIFIFQIDAFDTKNINAFGRAVEELSEDDVPIHKHIYDLLKVTNFPLEAIRAATRLKQSSPTIPRYVVILVKNERVRQLIDLVLSIQPWGQIRVMGDKETAITWLNEQVKPILS